MVLYFTLWVKWLITTMLFCCYCFVHGDRKLGRVPGESIFLSVIENKDGGVQTLQVDREVWDCKQSPRVSDFLIKLIASKTSVWLAPSRHQN